MTISNMHHCIIEIYFTLLIFPISLEITMYFSCSKNIISTCFNFHNQNHYVLSKAGVWQRYWVVPKNDTRNLNGALYRSSRQSTSRHPVHATPFSFSFSFFLFWWCFLVMFVFYEGCVCCVVFVFCFCFFFSFFFFFGCCCRQQTEDHPLFIYFFFFFFRLGFKILVCVLGLKFLLFVIKYKGV